MSLNQLKFSLFTNHLFIVIILYFIVRIPFLTKLPVFNDEAIYLEWAWRMTHNPGMLYYSLYDAKQPLLMWIFGFSQILFSDPLFAGRIVSVIAGCITLIGIYKIALLIGNKNVAFLSSLFYISVPFFVFFDRQALMESSIASCGVWACFVYLKYWSSNQIRYQILLGFIFGIGFLIKTSSLLFLITFLVISFYGLFRTDEKTNQIKKIFITLLAFVFTIFLLLINPQYWKTVGANSRYVLTLEEIVKFPLETWSVNFLDNIQIIIYHLTPLILVFSLIGLYMLFRKRGKILVVWIVLGILLETLTVKQSTARYIVAFLPLLTIPAAYLLTHIKLNHPTRISLIVLAFSLPLAMTIFSMIDPLGYIETLSRFTKVADRSYIEGQNSGVSVTKAVSYLKNKTEKNPSIITFAENTGNPESAIQIYFQKTNVVTSYFEGNHLGDTNPEAECLSIPRNETIYFVSRLDQQAGLNKFLIKETEFSDESGYTTGIYVLKKDCDKAIPVEFRMQQ